MKRGILFLLWLLSAALIGLNFWRYPVGNGRDEIYHLQLIDFYTREWRLTRLPQDWDDSSTQAHQPPLYHLTMAVIVELFLPELGRLEAFQLNPYMVYAPDRYDPTIPRYNRVVYVHHEAAAPYMTTIRVLQGLSILINLLGIFFVWRTVRVLEDAALPCPYGLFPVTLAFLAVTPTFWRRAMGVNNDQFIFLFAAIVTWLLAKMLRDGVRWRESIAVGIFLGLGLLTKIYMFPLVITMAVVLLWRGKKALPHLLVIGIITVLISGWWYIRNYRLYGDFTAAAISEEKLNTARTDPITALEVIEILLEWPGERWLEYDVILPVTRPALWLASGIGVLLTVSSVFALRRVLISGSGILLFGVLIPALVLAVIGQAKNIHGNYSPPIMMAALPASCILFAVGVFAPIKGAGLFSSRIPLTAILLVIVGMVVYHATVFEPLYPPLHVVKNPDDLAVKNRVQVDFENGTRLIGYEFDREAVRPAEVVRVKLCWEALENLDRQSDAVVTTALALPEHPNAAVMQGYPLSGRYPVSTWTTGTGFCEWIPLRIEESAVAPRVYQLSVGMAEEISYVASANLPVVAPLEGDLPERVAQVDDWGALVGYEAHLNNGRLTLSLDWLTLKSAPEDYTYYLHALDKGGNWVAGLDQPPLNGGYPTSFWQPRTRFQETLILEAVPPEAVAFRFGVYANDQRGQWMLNGVQVGDGLVLAVR